MATGRVSPTDSQIFKKVNDLLFRKLMKYLTIILAIAFYSCEMERLDIQGHWYLVDSRTNLNTQYVEFILGNNVSKINKDGLSWYDAEIKTFARDSIKMRNYLGKYKLITGDSLVIFDEENIFSFRKNISKDDISNKDLEFIRRLKYYSRTLDPKDSIAINNITYSVLYHFELANSTDPADHEDHIEVLQNY